MARLLRLASFAAAIGTATAGAASPQPVISEQLQQEAMTCVGEAAQVCPEVWTAADHGLACMTGKRQSFSPRCRAIYDKVAHALHVTPHDIAPSHGP